MIKVLRDKIEHVEEKRISYAEYMNTVLYHPTQGYYMKLKQKLGKEGDFYTSMHVHDIFAKMFVKVFARFFEKSMIKPMICEIGGGDGRFAKACLAEWDKQYVKEYGELTYLLVEASPYHRQLQAEALREYEKVNIYQNIEEVKDDYAQFNGIFFSNELFDALPVHVVEQHREQLMEVFVTLNDNKLEEELIPCENREVVSWVESYFAPLHEGQRIEVPLVMKDVLQSYSAWFDNVCMFTVDYGYWKDDWDEPSRRKGSLRGYFQHELIEDVLKHPGEMDITTHIQLDPFISISEQCELELLSVLRQNEFLLQAGILHELQENYDPNPFSIAAKQNRAIRSFIMGEGFGTAFHVLVQKKGLNNLKLADLLQLNHGSTLFEPIKKRR